MKTKMITLDNGKSVELKKWPETREEWEALRRKANKKTLRKTQFLKNTSEKTSSTLSQK